MTKVVYQGYIYEALEEKELKFAYDKFFSSLEDLTAVENMVTDGNMKKAIASLKKRTRDVFNEKIKGADYTPKSLDDMKQTADATDARMKEQQLADGNSTAEITPEQRDASEEKYA
jgi:hypothetical protein